jgi:tetratricopeptide (TPR) repeat protein
MTKCNPVLVSCLLALASAQLVSSANDFYPEIRTLILEAEMASAGITALPDKSNPLSTAAALLARAGYLDDAVRVGARAGVSPEDSAFAQTLYGDLPGALKAVAAMRDVERRTTRLTDIAHLLWRMGDRANASKVLDEAERIANLILNLEHRKFHLRVITQERAALSGEPPIPISALPHPESPKAANLAIPAFPVSVDGFRDEDPAGVTNRAKTNEEYLTRLYALVVAHDSEGLRRHTEQAATPFQKALGLASLEHLLIQVGAVEQAEQSARAIPDDNEDCSLAKAEALTATATAWGRKGDSERARENFDAALQAAASVGGSDLAFGKAVVTASIAAAQAESGMVLLSNKTFETALKLVLQIKPRPKPINGVYPKNYFGGRFQDGGYNAIFGFALRAHNLGIARNALELWRALGVAGVHEDIMYAWLGAGRRDEAISYAHSLKEGTSRAQALLWLARTLLDEAGAPMF